MFSLTRENSYLPFDLLALGYVAGDLGRPDDRSQLIPHG
jgi:hypothetical protein